MRVPSGDRHFFGWLKRSVGDKNSSQDNSTESKDETTANDNLVMEIDAIRDESETKTEYENSQMNVVDDAEMIDAPLLETSQEDLLSNTSDGILANRRYGRTYGPSKRKENLKLNISIPTKSSSVLPQPEVLAKKKIRQGSQIGLKSCEKCGYTTNHGGHFNLHKNEGCAGVKANKDMNCQICCKPFTYNQLRYHLRQYRFDTSKAINGHQYFSPAVHSAMMDAMRDNKKK